MKPTKIILKGYYGFGNLGDDILMYTSYRWLRAHYPAAEILIATESNDPNYVHHLLGENVRIIRNNQNVKADWIIHGGGGVFFDFLKGGSFYLWLNQIIEIIGHQNFKRIYRLYRSWRGTAGIRSRFRAGLGIGMGTYTPSSAKFYVQLNDLLDFGFMMVREEASLTHLKKLKVKFPISVGSDLAFLNEYWKAPHLNNKPEHRANKTVGIIIRDWGYDQHEAIHVMSEVTNQLIDTGYRVEFFSFDRSADPVFINSFSGKYPMHIWEPRQRSSFISFLQTLNQCSIVITNRAHGAILSAGLNIPAICLKQEPKLEQVSQMLRNSSALIEKPFVADNIINTVEKKLNQLDDLPVLVKKDVASNRAKVLDGLNAFIKIAEHY